MEFKKGAIARLNSGGPSMTMVEQTVMGHIKCKWWDDKKNCYMEDDFDPETLGDDEPKRE